jgi:hypothetical protein
MNYEQLVQLFSQDDKYVSYVAKRFLVPLSLDEIALGESLPVGTFHRLFVDFPEYEKKFNDKVEAEDENAKDLFLRQVSMKALIKLSGIIDEVDDVDKKDLIQACKALLTYRPSNKKVAERTPLDSIFSELVDEGDGK